MTKNEFLKAVKEEAVLILKEKIDEIDATIGETIKSNDVRLTNLTFKGASNVQPVVYMDHFYERYLYDGISLSDVAKEVANIYLEHQYNGEFNITSIQNFETVKDRIILSLYNVESNSEALKDMPHFVKEDLAIYFKVLLKSDFDETGTITVHNNLMNMWKISADELYQLAWKNTRNLCPPDIKTMEEVLKDMCNLSVDDMEFPAQLETPVAMYILTTQNRTNGSIYMMDTAETMENIAERLDDDLVILPSSLHEVIIMPRQSIDEDFNRLKTMVKEVNQTQVDPLEFLSNSVYLYERSNKQISKCA